MTVQPIDSPATESHASARWVLASLSLPMFMSSLDTSIANAGLPALMRAFHASFPAVQWIVLAYLLAITTAIVSMGRLGDMIGRRRLLLGGIAIFTIASLLCGAALTLALLIAARAAQGLGAAVMMALSIALVGESVPQGKTGSAMGLLGTMSAMGTALGPSLGGVLITAFGWRSIFLINGPVGIVTLLLAYRFLPVDRVLANVAPAGFDAVGTLLLAATLAAYALAMTTGHGTWGALPTALLLAALLGVACFVLTESRVKSPLIRLEMFRDPVFGASLAASALVSTVMMSTLVVGPFYLTHALGLPTALAGVCLSVGPVVVALSGVPAGRLTDRLGPQRIATIGLAAIAAGSLLLALLPHGSGIAGYLVPIVIITSGYALFQTSNNTLVMTSAGSGQRGVASAMLSLSRNLGLITGASLMGMVFALASGTSDISHARPEAITHGMRSTFAVAAVLMGIALSILAAGNERSTRNTRL